MTQHRPTKPTSADQRRAGGFTLVELLVVIGIIAVLMSILIPTVSKVRTRAYASNTLAQIQLLSGSIQQYHDVFNAYPGLLDDTDVAATGGGQLHRGTGAPAGNRYTSSELLVMALCGGAKFDTTQNIPNVGTVVRFIFDKNEVGKGPVSLNDPNVSTPKRYDAFVDPKAGGIDQVRDANGNWVPWYNNLHPNVAYQGTNSGTSVFHDSVAPEFVDRFPDALPILYARAKPGASGTVGIGPNANPTAANTWAPQGIPYAYDLTLLQPYQEFPAAKGVAPLASKAGTKYSNATNSYYLKDIAYYFAEPVDQNTATLAQLVARQKGGYMLISAGIDRVYATPDDITNAGPVKQ